LATPHKSSPFVLSTFTGLLQFIKLQSSAKLTPSDLYFCCTAKVKHGFPLTPPQPCHPTKKGRLGISALQADLYCCLKSKMTPETQKVRLERRQCFILCRVWDRRFPQTKYAHLQLNRIYIQQKKKWKKS